MFAKIKPFLVTAGVVLVTLAIVKIAKPYVPAAVAKWLP